MSTPTKRTESRDKLAQEVARLEDMGSSAVKPRLPEVKLDEISYTQPSDESLSRRAESELNDYRNNGIAEIKRKSEENAAALAAKREAYETDRESDRAALDREYRDASRAIDNDVIKRGLARSSVATSHKSDLNNEYMRLNADIISEYGKRISAIDAEIASVDGKLREALDDFNLTYATKLGEKLRDLKDERDKRVSEVTAFNNGVRQSQAKLDADREKTESELYSEALSQEKKLASLDGLPAEKRDEIYRAVYARFDEYLSGMSAHDAKVELLNHTMFREHLSQYYYAKLYDKYGR